MLGALSVDLSVHFPSALDTSEREQTPAGWVKAAQWIEEPPFPALHEELVRILFE